MAEDMLDHQTKALAGNIMLIAVARVSMALTLPAIGFVVWLGGSWLDQKFESQDNKIVAQKDAAENQDRITTSRIETVERTAQSRIETAEKTASLAVTQAGQVNNRLIAVETRQAQEAEEAMRFQQATLQRLDRLQDSVVSMSNAISALTAVLQTSQPKPSR